MRSSCRVSNTKLVDKVWEIFKDANTTSNNNGNSNGVKKDASVTDADNNVNNDVPQASSETGKGDTNEVKLNKKERKELRREKQRKKSKKDKHVEPGNKGKSGKKRKLECTEEEEPSVVKEDSRKQKKLKKGDSSMEQVIDTVEMKKKKKKKDISQVEALPQDRKNISNGTSEVSEKQVLGKGKENLVEPAEPPHPAVFKWTPAIKRVLKEAPEEGLKISKLQKKVFSIYYSTYSEAPNVKSKEELVPLLSRKLKKKNKFVMQKDRVKLQK